MGKIVVTEFVSLDGVMEDPGGAEDYKHGGWTFEISRGDEGDKFKVDEIFEAEAQLLGRTTYEGFAEKMNTMPKYVFSSTLTSANWDNSTILSGDHPDKKPLRLVDSKTVGDGVEVQTYVPA